MQADEIRYATAQLAAHLKRSGLSFLPAANAQRTKQYADSFESPTEAATHATSKKPTTPKTRGAASPGSPGSQRPSNAPPRRLMPVDPIASQDIPYPGPALPIADRETKLSELAAEASACTRCPELVQCRTNTVFGEGSPQPRFAFFGEGPGADEDRTGRPFVGRAGQLLTKMIEACDLQREDVYILNTVKCRPPGNRNPEPGEIDQCREYFENQLSTLRPEYVVCLGAVAAQALLQSKLSVGRLRGRVHKYFDSKVIVTYHPAYLLRNPSAKKAAWEDLQLMLGDAGIELPRR